MAKKTSIAGTTDAWESRALGASAAHVKRAPEATQAAVEEALGLQAISIRLPRSTIETYKNLAKMHGVGYQPLMRDAICRWAESEMKLLLIGAVEAQRQQKARKQSDSPPVTPPMKKAA